MFNKEKLDAAEIQSVNFLAPIEKSNIAAVET